MNRQEFERNILPLSGNIRATALKITHSEADADDVVQDTLLKLWSLRARLDSYASPAALAVAIARNKSIDLLRSRNVTIVAIDNIETAETTVEESFFDDEADRETDEIIAQLPPRMAMVLRMRHVDGLDISDIATLTASNEGAVRTALSRARKKVKEIFKLRHNNSIKI